MPKARSSAGVLLFRRAGGSVEVFLVHPGGPFFRNKDAGAWSIPKGELNDGEAALDAARREFLEETGFAAEGRFIPLSPVRQASGKVVQAWAVEGNFDPARLRSNTFEREWPPGSGRLQRFPEVDRAAWFAPGEAALRINPGQAPLIVELLALIGAEGRSPEP
jgi:predicted NUDIX family NTP pyrophosphohydrolase